MAHFNREDELVSVDDLTTPQGDVQELELCRICANSFESCNMFPLFDNDALTEIFRQVASIEDQDKDCKLPKSCCLLCKDRLQEVEDLRNLCQESNRKLKKMIVGSDAGSTVMLEILQLSQSYWEDSGFMAGSDYETEEESEEHILKTVEIELCCKENESNENADSNITTLSEVEKEDEMFPNLENDEMANESNSDDSDRKALETPMNTRIREESDLKPKKRCQKPNRQVPGSKKKRKTRSKQGKLPKKYQCASCRRIFKSNHSLKEHETTHSSEKAWKCHICSKDFGRRNYYVRHIKMHETEGHFKCNECERTFYANKLLQEHIRIKHVGDRPFKCRLCPNAAYARGSSLYAHIKIIHEKKQPFKCDICLRTFYTKNCLERHINRHKGIKTSQCPHCTKRYESNNYLQQHIAERHPERAQNLPRCQYCSAPYSTDSHYRKHVVAKHPESFDEFELWLKAKRKAT